MRDLPDISARARQLLEYIARYVEDNKRPPTRREMMQEMRLRSPQTADYHLTKLVESGYVDRTPHAHRGIELTDKGVSASSVGTLPILGQITAGDPILAQEEYSGDLAVGDYLSRVANFVLQVRGDSMVGADILDGDYVLIRRQPVAEPGQIVAALIIDGSETEATVKGYYPRTDGVEFRPANPAHEPIVITRESGLQWQILGIVAGRLRLGAEMPDQ